MDFPAIRPLARFRLIWLACEVTFIVVWVVAAAFFLRGPLDPELSTWIGQTLVNRIATVELREVSEVSGIIVLGGSIRRVAAALETAETFPGVPLVLSGPGSNEVQHASAHMREASRRIVVDRRPINTYQNALYAQDHILPKSRGCWVLVTSAIHMPRALGTFQAMSLPMLPRPVDDAPLDHERFSYQVWHEVWGLILYRIFGMTRVLLPSHTYSNSAGSAGTSGDKMC